VRAPVGSGSKTRWALLAAAAVVLSALIATSPTRRIGDGPEYLAMARQFARLERPSLDAAQVPNTIEELRHVGGGFGVFTEAFRYPQLEAADGRSDFPHFWFYPALAAPGVALAGMLHVHPNWGFVAANLALFLVALWVVATRLDWAASALLFASPILWWIDKAHTEVFTFSLLAIALATLDDAPWWSLLAVAAASTQNMPLALALPFVAAAAVAGRPEVRRDLRLRIGLLASVALALLHPVYYWLRLGTPEPQMLVAGARLHVPTLPQIGAYVWDPNLGILPNFPALALALLGALALLLVRCPQELLRPSMIVSIALAAVFTASFAQTTNFNSGGTPGLGRYGIWLIPLAIPLLMAANRHGGRGWQAALAALALASVAYNVVAYRPQRPERFGYPTALAALLWNRVPWLDDPLPEVFVERLTGYDITTGPLVPAATESCSKALLIGGRWPRHCTPVAIPASCAVPDTFCYANRAADGSYRYRRVEQ
jgi:hypothetical protein